MNCGNCERPLAEHCDVHVIPCCPGRCKGAAPAPSSLYEALSEDTETPAVEGVPDFMVAAMQQAGVDPVEVARLAETEDVIPDDADEVLRQAAAAAGTGMKCAACKGAADIHDPNLMVEVTGWSKHRTQGGQNHVIDRAETGAVMCGDCSLRLQYLGAAGFAQESLL